MKGVFKWSLLVAIILLLALIAILVLEIIDNRPVYNADLDFEFELSFGCYGRNNINTFNDTITKDLVSAGRVTVDYVMPEYARRRVFIMLRDMEIMDYPESLNFTINDPHVDYLYLRVVIEGEENVVRWTVPWGFHFYDGMASNISLQHYQFMVLVKYIERHVYKSETWESLPQIEGGYL
ncbi:MAG: hypothetical protein R3232_05470 [Clostridia bacterium]|nr:hypothetical protein [Clostridia bacterium]